MKPPVISFLVSGVAHDFAESARATGIELIEVSGAFSANAASQALSVARGEYVSFVDSGDRLDPDLVTALSELIAIGPIDMIYTDEIRGTDLVLKPVYSPERHRNQPYLGALIIYRRDFLESLGGLSADHVGAELFELVLRGARHAGRIERIAQVGITTAARPAFLSTASARNALEEHMRLTGGGSVNVMDTEVLDSRRSVEGNPFVSIVIPTRGDSATVRGVERCMVVEAIRGIELSATYKNLEYLLVADEQTPEPALREIRDLVGDKLRVIPWTGPFSFSGKMNLGAVHAKGDFILMLNDDVEVITPDFIESMLALAQLPQAGIVGAMLYFEDNTIQHAGHAYYRSDVTHIGLHSQRGATGPNRGFLVEREADGVTAACALVPRGVFFEAGGFTTLLPGNFNDVDLCMKIKVLGYQAYWTPHAELYHFESKSRDPRVAAYEIERAWGRWEDKFWDSDYWPDDPHTVYLADSEVR